MRVSSDLRHVGSRRAFTSAGLMSVPIGTRRLQSHSGSVTAAKANPRAFVSWLRRVFVLATISVFSDVSWACSAGEKISKRSSRGQMFMDTSLKARRRSRAALGIFSAVKVGESSMNRTCVSARSGWVCSSSALIALTNRRLRYCLEKSQLRSVSYCVRPPAHLDPSMRNGLRLGFHQPLQCCAQYDRVGFHLCEGLCMCIAPFFVKFPIGLLTLFALNTYRVNVRC